LSSGKSREALGIPRVFDTGLAFVLSGEKAPALLYDNHHPKGHHRHVGTREEPYLFSTVRQLVADFMTGAHTLAEGKK